MTDDEPSADLGTYELRVQGELGPILLSAIPHAAVARVPAHSVLVTEGSDDRDLLEIVRLIMALGVEVDSVRPATQADTYPSPKK
jgi:hypothetical protein